MFAPIARFMYRNRVRVVAAWVVVLIIAGIFAAQATSLLGAPDYTFNGSDSAQVAGMLDHTFHQNGLKTTLIIVSSPTRHVTDPAFRQAVNSLITHVRADRALRIDSLDNPLVSHNPQGISKDRHALVVTFSTRLSESDMEQQVSHLRSVTHLPGFSTALTGYSVTSYEQNQVATKDLSRAEAITLPILLIVLVLVFGALVAASVPFLIAIVSIVLCVAAVWVAAHFMSMSTYVLDIITFIGLGIAIDYSLFIVNRFREELASGADRETAIVRSMATTGRAIFFSGLAVAVGLSSLLITGLPFMQAMGLAGMVIPLATLIVTFTLLPAVLGLLGDNVNRFRVLPRRWLGVSNGGAWRSISLTIMRRPWLTGGAVLIILLALAVPVTRLTLSQGTLKQTQGTTPAVAALDYLRTNFHTASDPYAIIVKRPAGTVTDANELAGLRSLEQAVRRDPEVARVIGLPDVLSSTSNAGRPQAAGQFLSADRHTGLITVIPKDDSTTAANMAGLRRIRTLAADAGRTSLRGSTILVGGSSATLVDFDNGIISRLPLIAIVVLGLTYAFLFIAFRTVFLPLKAVVLNVLSVAAAFGMLQIVFQQGIGVGLLGGTKSDGVPTWVLLFLFAFLFGLSMDYEVLLLSRIREEWLRTGDNTESVVHGLEKTGRLISSAAVIMAIAFSGFILGTGLWMKEMGLGLTVSILLDATLIRIVLVPSIMTLVGKWNWWVPARLHDWSRRGGVEGVEVAPEAPEPEPVPA